MKQAEEAAARLLEPWITSFMSHQRGLVLILIRKGYEIGQTSGRASNGLAELGRREGNS
jgi:hypothetical protein